MGEIDIEDPFRCYFHEFRKVVNCAEIICRCKDVSQVTSLNPNDLKTRTGTR